jgi:hypothetical protein
MQDHWLARPENIKLMWRGFLVVLGLTVLSELFIDPHPYFGIDGTFGFHAWYGFAACVVMILGSKALGVLLKRPDSYYD